MHELDACIDRYLPDSLLTDASLTAIQENPANLARPTDPFSPPDPMALALAKYKMWKAGRILHVRFLGGDDELQAAVAAIALEWTRYANIRLLFDNDPQAEIRVAFVPGSSWSFVGTDSLHVPPDEATMNIGFVEPSAFQAHVLHEFGHALGCVHEHQNPVGGIQWDEDAVIKYYAGSPNYWSAEKTRQNVINKYAAASLNAGKFDKESIMLYPVPRGLTKNGFEAPWQNTSLSAGDQKFIAAMYPY
jgi:hypothetical protein